MTEELENSLLKSIETHLDDRLRAIHEELARLQNDFNETLGRLRANATTGQLESTPLGAAISAHLQAAREQKLSGTTSTPPAADFSQLKSAIDEISNQHTQSDVLSALIRNAAQFTDRAVLFVVKGDQAIAWRKSEATNRSDLQTVSGLALPLNGSTVVSQAARTRSSETSSGTRAEDGSLIEQLGGEAQQLAAVPLVVRRKVVAVLYADSAWPHRDAIQLDALEALTQVAAIAVELVSGARIAHPQPQVTAPESAAPREVESAPAPVAETMEAQGEAPSYTPHVEPAIAEAETERQEIAADRTAEPVAEARPVEAEVAAEPEPQPEPEEMQAAPVEAAPVETPAPVVAEAPVEPPAPMVEEAPVEAPPPVEQPAQPVFTAQYSTPLGTKRRWTRDAELPVDVSDEERPLHNDARRFARLLVSEIKLYNEQKVSEGRNQSDIYERLREDIDRSRQMYDKRVAPPVAARHDYFHHELVNTLAEGDPAKLGSNYPGAAVSVA